MSLLISTLLLSHCAWAQQSSTSHEFTIVADGREQASIVTSRNPSVSARFAAVELQEHVKQITGVELSIVTEDVATVGPRILVGSSDATAKLGITGHDLGSPRSPPARRNKPSVPASCRYCPNVRFNLHAGNGCI